jgi:hypothetical protein
MAIERCDKAQHSGQLGELHVSKYEDWHLPAAASESAAPQSWRCVVHSSVSNSIDRCSHELTGCPLNVARTGDGI